MVTKERRQLLQTPPSFGSPSPWESDRRTHRVVFKSSAPQRPDLAPLHQLPGSPTFERSRARVLGPGTYDPPQHTWVSTSATNTWVTDPTRPLSSFACQRPQRSQGRKPITADLDLAHSSQSNDEGALRRLHTAAPGTRGQKWTVSPRSPPFFHVKSHPYSFGSHGEPRDRDEGVDQMYDNAQTTRTMRNTLDSTQRRFASSFSSRKEPAPHLATPVTLGPGSYNLPTDTAGIRTYNPYHASSSFVSPGTPSLH